MLRSILHTTILVGALFPGGPAAQPGHAQHAPPALVLEQPAVRIGKADGDPDYLLFGATSGARLASGGVALSNTGTNQVRIYDGDGTHVRTIGGVGSGPGEFRGLQQVGVIRGDTIVAYDVHLGRITYFTSAGELAHTVQVRPFGNGVLPRGHGFTLDGRMLARSDFNRVFTRGPRRDTVVFALLDRDGAAADTLGRYAGAEIFIIATPEAALQRDVAFGRGVFASARGAFAVVGTNDDYRFDVYTATGTRARTHTVRHEPRRVQPADVRLANELWLGGMPDFIRGDIEKRLGEFPHGATYPAYGELLVAADGSIWVQAYAAPGSGERRWTVFAADGRLLRTVRADSALQLIDAGRDYALARIRDELGVERVHRFRIPPAH